jgi:D(-)-tartrate dehydratase
VAVGTLDMALWDAAAKIAGMPLHRFAAGRLGRNVTASHMPAYASGGYPYPDNDIAALSGEIQHFVDLGFTHVKIKIGGAPLDHDLRRIEAAAAHLVGSEHLAVDAMNTYNPDMSLTAATALALRAGGSKTSVIRWILPPTPASPRATTPIAVGEALSVAACGASTPSTAACTCRDPGTTDRSARRARRTGTAEPESHFCLALD